MTTGEIQKIIRERATPLLFDCSYLATRAHRKAFHRFARLLHKHIEGAGVVLPAVLDVGCGYKPFEAVLRSMVRVGSYTGVDFDQRRSYADFETRAEELPFADNQYDALIASEILEHAHDPLKVIREMRRVARQGALIYISIPFVFPEHGIPYDFNRFTSFWLSDVFKDDHILYLSPTNTSFATVPYVRNVCFKSITVLSRIPVLSHLVYAFNNILGLIIEYIIRAFGFLGRLLFRRRHAWFNECFKNYFYRMPAGFDIIVRIQKL